jgi:hypothetical protein
MIRRYAAVLLFVIGSAFLPWQSQAQAQQGKQDFYFVNSTGHTIVAIYLSPHSQSNWGSNRLDNPLFPDQKTFFSFENYHNCYWDVSFVTDDGVRWQETAGYNLCRLAAVAVDSDGGMAGLDANGEVVVLSSDAQ